MRQTPFRAGNEISQSFNSGVVSIYRLIDVGEPGYAPVPRLDLRVRLHYEERKLGLIRYFSASQNQVKVEKVLRVPRRAEISPQDVAVTQDGRQYRIELIQMAESVYPPSLDLTLGTIEQVYELPEEGSHGPVV